MIYPWQKEAWQSLVQKWENKPNAWLFYGREHIGKMGFIMEYAQALLCEKPTSGNYLPCYQCHACHLFSQNNHPDFYKISTDEGNEGIKTSEFIKIEAIRTMAEKVQTSSYLGGRKVVLIAPAEKMNAQASNALLKILEEPPAETIFLLVSHAKDRLLSTIISRCRQFSLPVPSEQEALEYLSTQGKLDEQTRFRLAFNSGVPFFTDDFPFELYQEFIKIMLQPRLLLCLEFAQHYESQIKTLDYFFDWVYKWLTDIILSKQGFEVKFNQTLNKQIDSEIKDKYNMQDLFALLSLVKQQARYKNHPLNVKLQIENIALEYLSLSIR
ncbi:DNA polymerase III subunit delta' [Neisseriaceae bacterium PsAf]|nr:DNA polymerase III subunit delta' [Neisseriaceae bacterium PsAf]MCV2502640.1 DNA polymerase III subunit delta' [Neisseriaceae bacterium]